MTRESRVSYMASTYPRGNVQWAKYFDPVTFEPLRDSLETSDPARAALLCRRRELEIELARPEIRSVELPMKIRKRIGIAVAATSSTPPAQIAVTPYVEQPVATVKTAARNASVPEAIRCYHRFSVANNGDHQVSLKLSILRVFFGTESVTEALGNLPEHGARLLLRADDWRDQRHCSSGFFREAGSWG